MQMQRYEKSKWMVLTIKAILCFRNLKKNEEKGLKRKEKRKK